MSSVHSDDASSMEDLDMFIDDVLSGKVDYEQEVREQELRRIDEVKRAFIESRVDRIKPTIPSSGSSEESEEEEEEVRTKPKQKKQARNTRGEDWASEQSIKIFIQFESDESLTTFFLTEGTKYNQFRKLVERQFGKLFATCFRHPGFGQNVEIDDDETFEMFLQRPSGDKLVLIALFNEPPPLHYNLPLWTAHECHAAYATKSRPLPPVDTIAAPHTLRAPAIFEDLKNTGIQMVRSDSPAHSPQCCIRSPSTSPSLSHRDVLSPVPEDDTEDSIPNIDELNTQRVSPFPGRRVRL